ncbi:hypothetical protein JCM18920_3097 [Cutibacterium acnes JCM 18920]|nr:hypothetical protein JCM18920_3097 [Cutibacterium acnes JCM 18920]
MPSSPQEHRTGSPNALVLAGKRADGGPGYLPVIVKDYLVLESHHTLAEFTWVSPLNDPDPRHARMSLDQTFRAAGNAPHPGRPSLEAPRGPGPGRHP